jgi:hypothetical protein
MPGLSQPEEIWDTFSEFFFSAHDKLPIFRLEQSLFSYDLPDNGLFGYLHVDKRSLLSDSFVRLWMFHDQIIGDIVWSPIWTGRNGDWRQHMLIRSVLAACDGCNGGTDTGVRMK